MPLLPGGRRWQTHPMTKPAHGANPRWLGFLLAAFVAVLVTLFGAGTAPATATTAAQTRVGAHTLVAQVLVGPDGGIGAGQRLGNDLPAYDSVLATGVALFSVKNSAVAGPTVLLNQKATLKDVTGKTALPNPGSTKGASIPDVPIKAEGGVGTVEVKTPFGAPPVDPIEYLNTHPRAANQLQRQDQIMSQGGITWGPSGGQQTPVQAGEGVGLTTGYWYWWPPKTSQ
jgi:hypothetical protein